MKELWPETFVEEVNLAQHISLLRKASGGTALSEPQYIETIPRRGYRFLAKVSEIVEAQDQRGYRRGTTAPRRRPLSFSKRSLRLRCSQVASFWRFGWSGSTHW